VDAIKRANPDLLFQTRGDFSSQAGNRFAQRTGEARLVLAVPTQVQRMKITVRDGRPVIAD
jgi:hypothetical protein